MHPFGASWANYNPYDPASNLGLPLSPDKIADDIPCNQVILLQADSSQLAKFTPQSEVSDTLSHQLSLTACRSGRTLGIM